ncbi:hypothetical protein B0T19DRAFT_398913 [Cercophora scortea]|uniref:Uncharacterized protein n=1 Tax=Cercophora scortea TaxID=314031 RepID=A0AAE0IXN9_9PEZI|nr:hypothetical protein B0T19DRAFT_398913 [Cercophora scortea]
MRLGDFQGRAVLVFFWVLGAGHGSWREFGLVGLYWISGRRFGDDRRDIERYMCFVNLRMKFYLMFVNTHATEEELWYHSGVLGVDEHGVSRTLITKLRQRGEFTSADAW